MPEGTVSDAARRASEAGVPRESIALDPGVGFGKAFDHSLALLRGVGDLAAASVPWRSPRRLST